MMRSASLALLLVLAACGGGPEGLPAAGGGVPVGGGPPAVVPEPLAVLPATFFNWENLGVHPIDVTPDGARLLVCSTPDARLEVFDLPGGVPVAAAAVPVGLDPVSVRARSATEAWVVNHISDSVSVVDLPTARVVATLDTLDEPCDVVFAGGRAYVSCSQANAVQVFDPSDLAAPPSVIPIAAEDPRAMAVSPDGREIYVAIFESGNGTTVLGGGADPALGVVGFPPNVVNDPAGPHAGVNPPPNASGSFEPAQRPGNPPPPRVALIVRKDGAGRWRDDTGADWTALVTGPDAPRSGRVPGWDVVDRDVAVIDVATGSVRYLERLMNLNMALAVHPGDGRVTVVGTDATNEVRFEPRLKGRFGRVLLASVDASGGPGAVADLNPHLDYSVGTVPQDERNKSLGDPRGIAWHPSGQRGFVTGLGSNNVLVIDAAGAPVARIDVGEGPTGVVLSPDGARAYVLSRFDMTVSVLDTQGLAETARVALFDPTPVAIRRGRKHLYDTHKTSGLGHLSCASCHIDGRIDRLAWDLGDPAGAVEPMDQNCVTDLLVNCEDFHPMKGPMLTQTLQDIVGKEPFHWRGDRDGLEEFNPAFIGLLGDDAMLTPVEMQHFEDFLQTLRFPPNPFRNPDNALPANLPLPGHVTPGRFAPAGLPLPDGDPRRGLQLYRTANLDGGVPGFQCVTCHTLPTGIGPDLTLRPDLTLGPLPLGPNGETHHALVSVDGGTNVSMKVPQLRNLYDRVGFDATRSESLAGFGFLHDGSVDTIARFVAEPVFNVRSDRDVADLVAFLLCFSGSDLPTGSAATLLEPPGPASSDTHAAVGMQATFGVRRDEARLALLVTLADAGALDLIATGHGRGWAYEKESGDFQSDRNGERATLEDLRNGAAPGSEVTFTAVPAGAGRRLAVDRDGDRFGDRTEADFGTDPTDPTAFPVNR